MVRFREHNFQPTLCRQNFRRDFSGQLASERFRFTLKLRRCALGEALLDAGGKPSTLVFFWEGSVPGTKMPTQVPRLERTAKPVQALTDTALIKIMIAESRRREVGIQNQDQL